MTIVMAKLMIPFLAWSLLLSLPIAAQEMDENITEKEQQRFMENRAAMQKLITQHIGQTVLNRDINAYILTLLTLGPGNRYVDSIQEEFDITEEHRKMLFERLNPLESTTVDEIQTSEATITKRLVNGPQADDLYLTKEEGEQIDMITNSFLEAIELSVAEVFTDEQREKADGMILALTGGLESPFFNERHMAALEMTDEQKKKFAAINEELKPERDKMIGQFIRSFDSTINKGDENLIKNTIDSLSVFKDYGRKIKKRRSEVLTSEQIAKAMKLSKLPKALLLSNLLPKWAPNADSWKPGDPLPEGLVPNPQPVPRFPIGEQY